MTSLQRYFADVDSGDTYDAVRRCHTASARNISRWQFILAIILFIYFSSSTFNDMISARHTEAVMLDGLADVAPEDGQDA